MKRWAMSLAVLMVVTGLFTLSQAQAPNNALSDQASSVKTVYVLPVRDDIMPPIVYIIRRGVKEAMAAEADSV